MARRMVVIENGLLASMAVNPNYLSQFPFLGGLSSPGKSGCGSCGGANAAREVAFAAAKSALANMSQEKKDQLRKMLDADKLRVVYMDGNQKVMKTF